MDPLQQPRRRPKTIRRGRRRTGLQVLLDFHYSDDWADGDKQHPPAAWAGFGDRGAGQGALRLYPRVLRALDRRRADAGAGPGRQRDQSGADAGEKKADRLDPQRRLCSTPAFERCARSGRDRRLAPRVMLHIAQPENVEPWFEAATRAGVTDYDLIGISYYRKWSTPLARPARRDDRSRARRASARMPWSSSRLSVHQRRRRTTPPTCSARTRSSPAIRRLPQGQLDTSSTSPKPSSIMAASASSIGSRPGSRPAAGRAGGQARTGRMPPGSACDRHEALPAFDFLGRKYKARAEVGWTLRSPRWPPKRAIHTLDSPQSGSRSCCSTTAKPFAASSRRYSSGSRLAW